MKNKACVILNPGESIRKRIATLHPESKDESLRIGKIKYPAGTCCDLNEARSIRQLAIAEGEGSKFKVAIRTSPGKYRILPDNDWIPSARHKPEIKKHLRRVLLERR